MSESMSLVFASVNAVVFPQARDEEQQCPASGTLVCCGNDSRRPRGQTAISYSRAFSVQLLERPAVLCSRAGVCRPSSVPP